MDFYDAKGRIHLMASEPDPFEKKERLTKLVGEALLYAANEPGLLRRFEEFFSPKPAVLQLTRDLTDTLNRLDEQLGGVPRVIITEAHADPPKFDTYGVAAIKETLSSFD